MRFEFHFSREAPAAPAAWRDDAPMRLLVMADLSGRAGRADAGPATGLGDRPLLPVDHETLAAVFARCAPRLAFRPGGPDGPELTISFARLDDFHPDALVQNLGLFEALRATRERLRDPVTFAIAANELGRGAAAAPASAGGEVPAATPSASIEGDAETINRLLGSAPADPASARIEGRTREDVRRFVSALIAPHVVAAPDPRQDEMVEWVDRAIGAQMRALLHAPAFQALESTWRSIERLVSEVETGGEIEIVLLDVSRAEIEADLTAAGADLEASALHRLLVERAGARHGAHPWTLIVGACTFGPEPGDVALLGALGAIASRAGGPFIAAAAPALLGCRSLATTPDPREWRAPDAEAAARWAALRASPWARWIGLALPRVLVRLPYGALTVSTERFAFEEFADGHEHEDYLWGHPAFACATLLARSFRERGWAMSPGDDLELAGLPAHTTRAGGESRLQPCAEALLTERALGAMIERGLMPFMSFPDRDAVRLVRFQSLAGPAAALAGAWA